MSMKTVVMVMVAFSLAACASRHVYESPYVIHERAHSGGSVVAFSRSGALLASGGWEGTVHLWQLPQGSHVRRWQAHEGTVNGIAFIAADRQIVTAGYDGVLASWNTGGGRVARIDTGAPVTHMEADAAGQRLVTGHTDGSVRLWRLPDLALLREQVLHRGSVKAVAIDPGFRRYASAGTEGDVLVWPEAGEARALQAPPADAWTLAFAPDGNRLLGGSWFRLFRWDLDDGSLTTIPTGHHGIIKSIQFLPGGKRLASISRQTDSAVYFLDPETGTVRRRFQRHELCGADIAVSPGGRYLATTSDDASVRIWRLDKPERSEIREAD
jgi:WD40 repeat protein